MEIVHRIVGASAELKNILEKAGFVPKETSPYTFEVEVSENDPRAANAISAANRLNNWSTTIQTRFDDADLSGADYVAFGASLVERKGHPVALERTYDRNEFCKYCGIGRRQIGPFRLSGPMRWGRDTICLLNGIYEEVFVPPGIWDAVFRPFGISRKSVLRNKDGAELENVVQLDISETAELDMSDDRLLDVHSEICRGCGRPRYGYITRGYMPLPVGSPGHLFKSAQYFGSGPHSHREIYASHELYEKMRSLRAHLQYDACLPRR